jgi:hypothetical protein
VFLIVGSMHVTGALILWLFRVSAGVPVSAGEVFHAA